MKTNILANFGKRALIAVTMLIAPISLRAGVSLSDFAYNREGGYYEVRSAQDLRNLSMLVNSGNHCFGLTFKLTANVAFDTISINNFVAIGTSANAFAGTFDGDGYVISGINITKRGVTGSDSFQGIFGRNRGLVKNLTLSASTISGYYYVGGIVGQNNGGGMVTNCRVMSNVRIYASAAKSLYHGGIVGFNRGTIRKCSSAATIADNGHSAHCYIGGIAGYNSYYVSECTSSASLCGEYYVEGLVGQNDSGACTGCHYYGGTIRRYLLAAL